MIVELITGLRTDFLQVVDFLTNYHDSIIASSVIFGGGWWILDSINKLLHKRISLENTALFEHLDDNKNHILKKIGELESHTKNQDQLIKKEIEALSDKIDTNQKANHNRIRRLEEQYDFLLQKLVTNVD